MKKKRLNSDNLQAICDAMIKEERKEAQKNEEAKEIKALDQIVEEKIELQSAA